MNIAKLRAAPLILAKSLGVSCSLVNFFKMKLSIFASVTMCCLSFLLFNSASWADSRADAILEMAVEPRRDVESMAVEYRWHKESAVRKDIDIRLETLGELIRVEVRYEGELLQQSLLLPDFVWDYSPGSNMIERMTFDTAVTIAVPCLNPRLIGFSAPLHILDTFAMTVDRPYDDTRVIGTEMVEGVTCTIVRTERRPFEKMLVTISRTIDTSSGRIYRNISVISQNGKDDRPTTTISTFGDDRPDRFDWLPTSVTNDHPIAGADFLDIELKETSVNEDRFTLASMGWPVGVSVHDKEAKKRLGFWNGTEIVPDFPLSHAGEVVAAPNNQRQYYVFGAIGVALVAAGSFLYLRRRNA